MVKLKTSENKDHKSFKEFAMIASKNGFFIGLVVAFILTHVPTLFAENFSAINVNKPAGSLPKEESYKLFAELDGTEKFIYYADMEPGNHPNKRMTWEGVLATDSPERISCKKSCLANYGIDGKSKNGGLCDDRGWNRCLGYMKKSFWPTHTDGCRDDLKTQCMDCWQKHTQSCYDDAFTHCLGKC